MLYTHLVRGLFFRFILFSIVCGIGAAEKVEVNKIVNLGKTKVENLSLKGKVMCGYQGWFAAKGDSLGRGWVHYGKGEEFAPGFCTIDLWPDMSEMGRDEKFPTPFRHKDGAVAYVFSSTNKKTVMRHFSWMQEYGIDGIFLQRFGTQLRGNFSSLRQVDVVRENVEVAAKEYGRVWAVMYDLSGLKAGEIESVVKKDWQKLIDLHKVTRDKNIYLRHDEKPVVAIWGVGFSNDRDYSLEECEKLVDFFKNDRKYGGNCVMLGVPTYWRYLERDALTDKALHRIIAKADIVSPWTVGRYKTIEMAEKHVEKVVKLDLAWSQEKKLAYMPVIFPGFSWQNLQKTRQKEAVLNEIPRLKGEFFWSQANALKSVGAEMIYVAMFDEIDEGTAIFKCTNNPPIGASAFATYEDLPSDHYLWLTGKIGELLRGEIAPQKLQPKRDLEKK